MINCMDREAEIVPWDDISVFSFPAAMLEMHAADILIVPLVMTLPAKLLP